MENRTAKPNAKNSQEYPPSRTYCSLLIEASLRPIGRYLGFSLQNSPYLKKARAIKRVLKPGRKPSVDRANKGFRETAHLPLLEANINTSFILRAKN